jgi:hypothetical protein
VAEEKEKRDAPGSERKRALGKGRKNVLGSANEKNAQKIELG